MALLTPLRLGADPSFHHLVEPCPVVSLAMEDASTVVVLPVFSRDCFGGAAAECCPQRMDLGSDLLASLLQNPHCVKVVDGACCVSLPAVCLVDVRVLVGTLCEVRGLGVETQSSVRALLDVLFDVEADGYSEIELLAKLTRFCIEELQRMGVEWLPRDPCPSVEVVVVETEEDCERFRRSLAGLRMVMAAWHDENTLVMRTTRHVADVSGGDRKMREYWVFSFLDGDRAGCRPKISAVKHLVCSSGAWIVVDDAVAMARLLKYRVGSTNSCSIVDIRVLAEEVAQLGSEGIARSDLRGLIAMFDLRPRGSSSQNLRVVDELSAVFTYLWTELTRDGSTPISFRKYCRSTRDLVKAANPASSDGRRTYPDCSIEVLRLDDLDRFEEAMHQDPPAFVVFVLKGGQLAIMVLPPDGGLPVFWLLSDLQCVPIEVVQAVRTLLLSERTVKVVYYYDKIRKKLRDRFAALGDVAPRPVVDVTHLCREYNQRHQNPPALNNLRKLARHFGVRGANALPPPRKLLEHALLVGRLYCCLKSVLDTEDAAAPSQQELLLLPSQRVEDRHSAGEVHECLACREDARSLVKVLGLLPDSLREAVQAKEREGTAGRMLTEVCMDAGRPPFCRFDEGQRDELRRNPVTCDEVSAWLSRLIPALAQNGARLKLGTTEGLAGTLHSVFALRPGGDSPVCLSLRLQRHSHSLVDPLWHDLEDKVSRSLRFLGTHSACMSFLRESARLLSTRARREVVVFDTNGQISGCGLDTLCFIGKARRVELPETGEQRFKALTEAVRALCPHTAVLALDTDEDVRALQWLSRQEGLSVISAGLPPHSETKNAQQQPAIDLICDSRHRDGRPVCVPPIAPTD